MRMGPGNEDSVPESGTPLLGGFGVEYRYSALADPPLSEIAEDSGLNIRNRRTQNILEGGPMYIQRLTELFKSSSDALAAR